MSGGLRQTPLREVLEIRPENRVDSGQYTAEFPLSACFGTVTIGGLPIAFVHSAAVHFMIESASPSHCHVLYSAVQFCRPTLPSPRKAVVLIKVVNSAKDSTTLHVELLQNKKLCITAVTGGQLSPPPIHASIESLESDTNPNWISYLTPFNAVSYRRPQAYIRYHIPMKNESRHRVDQWITPGWDDNDLKDGPVWTNELIHFAIDDCLPLLNDLIGEEGLSLHERIVQAGLAQRKARAEGRSDSIVGEGLGDDASFPYIVSTIAYTTEIKRLLPPEGTKWLFLRVTTKSLLNNRMDYHIVVMDRWGNLVAVSNHVLQVIHVDLKKAKKPRL